MFTKNINNIKLYACYKNCFSYHPPEVYFIIKLYKLINVFFMETHFVMNVQDECVPNGIK